MKQTEIIEIFKETKNLGCKIALVVKSGGLRRIVSTTLLKIFEDLGLGNQVDAVAGTSAEVINPAYFLNKKMNSYFSSTRKWPMTISR